MDQFGCFDMDFYGDDILDNFLRHNDDNDDLMEYATQIETHQNESESRDAVATTSISDDVDRYLRIMANPNTQRKIEMCSEKFERWMKDSPFNETRELINIPSEILDTYVSAFLMSLKKANGEEYEPDTLTSYHSAINRKLEHINYGKNLMHSDFKKSKKILEMRRKELKKSGKGNRPHKSESLSEREEEMLWESGELGQDSPKSLLNTVWFMNTKLLGFRGCQENRQLQWGDLELKEDENKIQYLEFNERETKTRSGNSTYLRPFQPKIFPNMSHPDKCPVAAYKAYSSHRPAKMQQPESPFYIAINHNRSKESSPWYKCQPMGTDSLAKMMATMAKRANIPGRKTNHSLRKTMCSNLLHAGVPPTAVAQLSGHKNVQSLNNYAVASHQQQYAMCNILQGNKDHPSVRSVGLNPALNPTAIAEESLSQPPTVTSIIPSQSLNPMQTTTNAQLGSASIDVSNRLISGIFSGAVFNGTVNININI